MASSHLKENLECSVCLNIYTDPVTLKCGHNYCRECIGRVLDTQEEDGGYSCPECREKFKKRPVLQKNITLCKISEALQTDQGDRDKTGVFCTYCIHIPVPAVISCLHCEASLCDDHLRLHSKAPEHVLCDPTTSPENRRCSVHKELLKYYCTEDSSCICMSCRMDGEHRGHQVETLDEASEKKKKKLRNVLQKLMTEREETEKKVQSLEEHRRKEQGKADEETELTALFRDVILKTIQELEIKKDELYSKIYYIEELCNMTDPLTVLQESGTGDLCDTEDGDDEDRERHDELLHDGGDLDVAGTSHTLHTGLSDIMSGGNVEKCTGTHVYPHSTTGGEGHTNAEPSRPHPQPSPTIQHSHCQTSGVTDILLDVRTAGNNVHILDDRKTVYWIFGSQNLSETPERFQYNQVMSSQSFSSGRHYWEVDVEEAEEYIVGMCYPSIAWRGGQSKMGYNRKSWGLGVGIWLSQYYAIHDSNQIPLPGGVSSNRVGIDLDYDAGRISFYDLCDPIRHLHTFTTTFTEPLHAGVWLYGGCLKICEENQM
ncbi:E3 ubiquitin/ISG15 ligase TRIM25-like [Rana temporaria]|uniref:E3 ubiquitin/ISG15 ligase TRIM25-like n=1 Tax=Rana temporaria TaxID=8407 RepID=UPI001AAE0A86|nr:E3 ubiquitin/ISG15 ligase TRIM25-like [Rana temporaria]